MLFNKATIKRLEIENARLKAEVQIRKRRIYNSAISCHLCGTVIKPHEYDPFPFSRSTVPYCLKCQAEHLEGIVDDILWFE
jgi:hypothetical protein